MCFAISGCFFALLMPTRTETTRQAITRTTITATTPITLICNPLVRRTSGLLRCAYLMFARIGGVRSVWLTAPESPRVPAVPTTSRTRPWPHSDRRSWSSCGHPATTGRANESPQSHWPTMLDAFGPTLGGVCPGHVQPARKSFSPRGRIASLGTHAADRRHPFLPPPRPDRCRGPRIRQGRLIPSTRPG